MSYQISPELEALIAAQDAKKSMNKNDRRALRSIDFDENDDHYDYVDKYNDPLEVKQDD